MAVAIFCVKIKGTRNKYRLSVGYGVDSKHRSVATPAEMLAGEYPRPQETR